jgi:hypothetical protein
MDRRRSCGCQARQHAGQAGTKDRQIAVPRNEALARLGTLMLQATVLTNRLDGKIDSDH